ncbi:sensor domain-containing diguanylate cyclase [Roseibium aggregatum]|uniref:sensor domain-containing diguanylate cyclase n=1 Tax=Roseibium aggregatum TaxID=187304 RepID=UPI001AD9059F|nr:GGDEF domain-containing protein [Roseibium aggregatum]
MNVGDAGRKTATCTEPVGIGCYMKSGHPSPELPDGYDLQTFDAFLHSDICTFQICLLGAELAEFEDLLAEARSLLGDDCHFIACVQNRLDVQHSLNLLDMGMDDVVVASDKDGVALALKRATRAVDRENSLRQLHRQAVVERNNLQAAIDNLPSPIFFKNRAGIYSGCNKAFEEYIGLPSDEVHGSSVYDVAPPELAKIYESADEELMSRGGVQIYEAEVRYANGDIRNVTFHKAVTHDKSTGEVSGLAGAMLDITDRKRLEERLKRAAERDDLTNAYNRRKFFEMAGEIEIRSRQEGIDLSVLVVDVDHFKQINDRFGHACGDNSLCHLVGILEKELPEPHVFARAGGEEFFCLLYDCDIRKAYRIADAIRAKVDVSPYNFDGLEIFLKVSIGVADVGDGEKLSQAIIRADQALYRAKEEGRNRVITA